MTQHAALTLERWSRFTLDQQPRRQLPKLRSKPPVRERLEITNFVRNREAFQIPTQVAIPVEKRVRHRTQREFVVYFCAVSFK